MYCGLNKKNIELPGYALRAELGDNLLYGSKILPGFLKNRSTSRLIFSRLEDSPLVIYVYTRSDTK